MSHDAVEVFGRAHKALAEVGMTHLLAKVRTEDGQPHPILYTDAAMSIENAWRVRSLANMENRSPRCLACFVHHHAQWERGIALAERTNLEGCEAFGRFPLRDCGVPRP